MLAVEFQKKKLAQNVNNQSDGYERDNSNSLNEDHDGENDDEIIKETFYFETPSVVLNLQNDLDEHYDVNIIEELKKSLNNKSFQTSTFTLSHIIELNVQSEDERIALELREHVFNRRIRRFALINNNFYTDLEEFLKDAYSLYKTEIERLLEQFKLVKTMTVLTLEFEKKKFITKRERSKWKW